MFDKNGMAANVRVEPCTQFIYVSSAVEPFTTEQLLQLVRHSQEFNTAHGVTGMLLHQKGEFIQVLEGPASTVRPLMGY